MPTQQSGPGKRPFYKYSSPDTGLAILRSKKVRYSSPLSFNDPFDVQSGLHFEFDLGTLHAKVLDRMHQLAAGPEEPAVDPEDIWGKVVLAARAHYPTHGFPRERWEHMWRESFGRLTEFIADTQEKYQNHWRTFLLPGIRVFCVSEDKDNLLMWAHYARDHTGCVFEFWSLPDEDNALSVAEAVDYVDTPPPFFTEVEWLDDLMGVKKLDASALYRRYAHAKSTHWAYEREWRIWYPFSKSSAQHDDVAVRESELRALYIGCRASPAFAEEATSLIRRSFPAARVFRAAKREDTYALRHVEV
jgi:hypothetical protein